MSGSETFYDPETGATIINETDIPTGQIMEQLDQAFPEALSLARWGNSLGGSGRQGSIFERDRYVTPVEIFKQFRTALDAANHDDVVSGVLESTEALAFNKMSMDAEDEDEADVWNQIMAGIDMDARLREMWREGFTVSQFYAAILWGTKSFKVSGTNRKKTFSNLKVPTGLTLLDPLKVVPVGNFMFGLERLAYIADREEGEHFDQVLAGDNSSDLIVGQLIDKKYEPSKEEKKLLQNMTGANMDHLFLMKKESVFRHTATRPGYERFATCRMSSVFELLDLKNQLRQMDRAYLIGGTNFIVLVKKGDKDRPATQGELSQLAGQVRGSARVPVIVGDDRIEIEIITPKLDQTLKPERYNTIDARITARLYQMFMTGNYAAGAQGDDSIKLARVVARGMESRRHMIRRTLEEHLIKPTLEANVELKSEPTMNFHPKRIALDFDPNYATYLLDLRDRGDVSRDTVLSEIDIDEGDESRKREIEAEKYDKHFKPTTVPFDGQGGGTGAPAAKPATANPKGAGRAGGGTTGGGGQNKNSGTSGPARGPAKPE